MINIKIQEKICGSITLPAPFTTSSVSAIPVNLPGIATRKKDGRRVCLVSIWPGLWEILSDDSERLLLHTQTDKRCFRF
jgi:hypothetical protein